MIAIASNGEVGVLYGVFRLLRELTMHVDLDVIDITDAPRIDRRMLNHWDNLEPSGAEHRTIERGYAGETLWIWDELPQVRQPYYRDYARAMASIGLNGTVLNNVNADPRIMTGEYLEKVAALAEEFRPYGIRVYLSASFVAPMKPAQRPRKNRRGGIGHLETADPLEPAVRAWWRDKVAEIYRYIPDFGGLLVKADSEGMSGPHAYGRTHAEGANMLAEALAPYDGLVIWRAFVYDDTQGPDRVKMSYDEFKPLDGQFAENVVLQVKNGPLDFQPREPVHPLFGAMPRTRLAMEFQIAQEYLGHNIDLAYLGPLWEEVLRFNVGGSAARACSRQRHERRGTDSLTPEFERTVSRVIDGSLDSLTQDTVIAGVANTGIGQRPFNWCGHPFAQANWYCFGRLAWEPDADVAAIAAEWIRMTVSQEPEVEEQLGTIMMESREAVVNYTAPLGLPLTVEYGPHYEPDPASRDGVLFHVTEEGIGRDRSSGGTNAVAQYHPEIAAVYDDAQQIPLELLLWFHFVRWDRSLCSGRTLWDEIVHRYTQGVNAVESFRSRWATLKECIDERLYLQVQWLFAEQLEHARRFRDTYLDYFARRSGRIRPERSET